DLRKFEIDILTLGQYLRPSLTHLPVERYYSPEEFKRLEEIARKCGFLYVAAGPMVRSSYKASELFIEGLIRGTTSGKTSEKGTTHGI
ncbi:MAG: lipoyl synthase, partial [Bdellovibrionales bacterium]|nr:lipoyl synthase [Oligoflexia bacterium]